MQWKLTVTIAPMSRSGGRKRKAMADQITTASTLRLRRRMSRLTRDDIDAVARAVRVQLGL